jgi:acyl-CoA synthetase (AMP-forming)/AMP-acid ligase II
LNIAELLRIQAQARPDSAAIIDGRRGRERVITFAQLDSNSARAATLLQQSGLKPGDAVFVLLPMSAELYMAILALFRLNMVAMFVDPSAGVKHLEESCALNPPQGLIAGPKAHLLRLVSPALRKIPVKFVVGMPLPGCARWWRFDGLRPSDEIAAAAPETPALLTFTSGSTGQPKAAVRTHGLLAAQHQALKSTLNQTPGEIDLTTMPIVLLANLAAGVTSLIPDADLRRPGEIQPGPVIAQIQEHHVQTSVAAPAFFERLIAECARLGITLPSLRRISSGGAPVFPRLLGQLGIMAPAAEIVAVYGSTEAEPIAHIASREMSAADIQSMLGGQGLLAGRPVDEILLRVMRDQWGKSLGPYSEPEFAAQCLETGKPGEIVVSGSHVLPGYLDGRGDSETKFRVDGTVWHRTGDAGYLDDQGRLWLLGRCVAQINDEYGTLYPFAAECAVYQFPEVRRAAVLVHEGQRALALETPQGARGVDLHAIRKILSWAHLEKLYLLEEIPVDRRHNSKVDYVRLKRVIAGRDAIAWKDL